MGPCRCLQGVVALAFLIVAGAGSSYRGHDARPWQFGCVRFHEWVICFLVQRLGDSGIMEPGFRLLRTPDELFGCLQDAARVCTGSGLGKLQSIAQS